MKIEEILVERMKNNFLYRLAANNLFPQNNNNTKKSL